MDARLKHDEGWNIPADLPWYPPLPAYYRNVRFQIIFFRADPQAIARLLPEPLEPIAEGLCVAYGIDVPWCSSYGPFQESAIMEQCSFRGQAGFYCSHVFLNSQSSIAAGREIYGTPKVQARMQAEQHERITTMRTYIGGAPIISTGTTIEQPADPAELPPVAPAWRLKLIPRADGPGPALKQLIDGAPAGRDQVIHALFRARAALHFEPSATYDFTALRPREIVGAFYMESSYAEGYAEVVYDYLKAGSAPAAM